MNGKFKVFFIVMAFFLIFSHVKGIVFPHNVLLAVFSSRNLAPPYNDKSVFINSYGQASYEYDFSLSSGEMGVLAKAVKGFGVQKSSSQIFLSIIKTWTVDFNGRITGIEVTYSLKGYMVIQVSAISNVYGGVSGVHFSLKFDDQVYTLENKRLEQYGTGGKEYHYNLIAQVKSFDLQRYVSKGERITIVASLMATAEAYGAIEDYSFANSDFYMGSFGAKLSVKILYLEETILTATSSESKAYLGDTIVVSGKLISSDNIPLAGKKIDLYFDGDYVKSTYTSSDGLFLFSYDIPVSTTPGTKFFTIRFSGDNSYFASQASLPILIPTFSVYTYTSGIKIPVGGSQSLIVHVYDVDGYDKNVMVKVEDVPSWLNVRFSGSNSDVPPFDVAITFKATEVGTAMIKIVGIGDDGQRRVVNLRVRAYNEPSFEIQVSPTYQSIFQGGSTVFNVTITPLNGYSGEVHLNLTSPEINIPHSFSVNPVMISDFPGEVELSIHVSASLTPSLYTLKVVGDDSVIRVESNTFLLDVEPLPKSSFELNVYPKNQTIMAGDLASYSITLSSLNNFEGNVYLNVTLLNDFSAELDMNPVYLSMNQTRVVNFTIISSEVVEEGYYNFTVIGYSGDIVKSDWIGLTVINYPAKIDFFYVNWVNKKWFPESRFLPFEAVGIVIRYEPHKRIAVEFPREVVHPYYKNIIYLSTNASGIVTAIIPLGGPVCLFGSHLITLRDLTGEIIGEGRITLDGAKINYRVKNHYGYSVLYFNVSWDSTGSLVLNRDGTLELELRFPNHSVVRSPPILGNGSIIFSPPRIDAEMTVLGVLLYAGTNQKVYEVSFSPSTILIKFRSIASYLIQKRCVDLNYNLKIKVYYRFTLKLADNVTVKLIVLDNNGKILLSVEEETDQLGVVHFSLRLPLEENLVVKILCLDKNDKWVTCSEWADLYVSQERLEVMITTFKNGSVVSVRVASMCGLMDLHCTVTVEIYDIAGNLQYTYIHSTFIPHGSPTTLAFPVNKLKAYYIHVKVDFRGFTLGDVFERIVESE